MRVAENGSPRLCTAQATIVRKYGSLAGALRLRSGQAPRKPGRRDREGLSENRKEADLLSARFCYACSPSCFSTHWTTASAGRNRSGGIYHLTFPQGWREHERWAVPIAFNILRGDYNDINRLANPNETHINRFGETSSMKLAWLDY